MIDPRGRRRGHVCARLGEEVWQRMHAVNRRRDAGGEWLGIPQEQGQDRESAFRGVERGVPAVELRERVLHVLELEMAVGDLGVSPPSGVEVRGRERRQVGAELTALREVASGRYGGEIGQGMIV